MRKSIVVMLLGFFAITSYADTIWSEDFASDEGVGAVGPTPTITAPSSGKWSVDVTSGTLSADTDWFKVVSGVLEARDVDGTQQANGGGDGVLWTSESIDISGYTGVSISVAASENGTAEDQDFAKASYKLDSGSITQFGHANDDFTSTTFTVSSLSGSTLIIYLEADNNAGTEYNRFDDVVVTGTPSGGVSDPTGFAVTPSSSSQLDLTWTENVSGNDILIAWNSSNSFGTPVDGTPYAASASIPSGGTSLGTDADEAYSHTSLTANTLYYYKIWSVDGSTNYSSGVTGSATTNKIEPTNHVTSFSAVKDGTNGHSAIDLSWTANDGSQVPDGYLIKASTADNITDASDGTAVSDNAAIGSNSGAKNITHGTNTYEWTGLTAEQTYYFKVYPYTNSGTAIDYKTAATVPSASATTDATPEIPALIISEVTDPGDVYQTKFVELYNASGSTINFTTTTFYLSRQANGGSFADIQLTGTLADGGIYVVAYNQTAFEDSFDVVANIYDGSISGNGDDGYMIYYGGGNATGTLYDIYGVLNEDGSGKTWEYLDSRAVRKGVTTGNTTWTASEWTIASANASDCTPGVIDNDQSLPVELSVWKATSTRGQAQGPSPEWEEISSFATNSDLLGQGSTSEQNEYAFIDKQVKVGKSYSYRLSDVDYRGNVTRHAEIKVTVKDVGTDLKPSDVKLHKAFPNPFNPDVNLSFTLENEVEELSLEIYDIKGALVQTLSSGYHETGAHSFGWNGYDSHDIAVSSGVYMVRLSAGSVIQIQRVTLLR